MPKAARSSTERSEPEAERFDLRIERFGDGWRAQVQGTRIRGAEVLFRNPFSEEDLEKFRRAAEKTPTDRELCWKREDLREVPGRLGTLLYQTVFSGRVLEAWRESLGRIGANRQRLILALDLRDAELARWPWEYLRELGEKHFIGQSKRTPIVRYLAGEVRLPSLPVELPVRILVVFANPWRAQSLDGEREWEMLHSALSDLIESGLVQLDRLSSPTFPALQRQLSQVTCHILHFIGHGGFDGKTGSLVFENDQGEPVEVSAESLGGLLYDSDLRLVVLNSCHGGRAGKEDPFSGVAQSLIQNNAAAVVAMQFSVPDASAVSFSHLLYESLAKGDPIDLAITEARRGLSASGHEGGWGNPVLYLRSSEVRILPVKQALSGREILVRAMAVPSVLMIFAALVVPFFWTEPNAEEVSEAPVAVPLSLYAAAPEPVFSHPRCPSPSDVEIKFVLIEPGELGVGSGKGARLLKLPRPLCVSIYETTRQQWSAVMGNDPGPDPKLPITGKSYNDAMRFLEKLRLRDPGAGYRLPTESEWEFAARADSTDDFSFGDDPTLIGDYANCQGGTFFDGFDSLTPVGKYKPNKWGLYDMQGNAWEWVSPDQGDRDPRPRRKGGSWRIQAEHCDLARSEKTQPTSSKKDYGFRIVRDPLPLDQNKGAAEGPPLKTPP